MFNSAQDAYLESRVHSADPLELVRMLYQGAIGAVQNARRHLAEGKIAARSRSISCACDILMELHRTLDQSRGGEIASCLAALYAYMHGKLLEANCQQIDPPLGEVLSLLGTLTEAWAGASNPAPSTVPAGNSWIKPQEPAAARAPGDWSL
jgi:flagellar protein FliS